MIYPWVGVVRYLLVNYKWIRYESFYKWLYLSYYNLIIDFNRLYVLPPTLWLYNHTVKVGRWLKGEDFTLEGLYSVKCILSLLFTPRIFISIAIHMGEPLILCSFSVP
jgi:hypothetical protein